MPILSAEPDMYPADLWEGDLGVVPDLDSEGFPEPDLRRWYCLHTRPRQEKATARDLRARRVPFYLPQMIHEDRTPGGRKTRSVLPLFGGYLFLLGGEAQRIEALRGNRLVNVLEVRDQAGLVRDLRQVHRLLASGRAIVPEPSAPVGSLVRIKSGPLIGLVGTVVRRDKGDRFTAVVSMLGLGASVALEDWQVELVEIT